MKRSDKDVLETGERGGAHLWRFAARTTTAVQFRRCAGARVGVVKTRSDQGTDRESDKLWGARAVSFACGSPRACCFLPCLLCSGLCSASCPGAVRVFVVRVLRLSDIVSCRSVERAHFAKKMKVGLKYQKRKLFLTFKK